MNAAVPTGGDGGGGEGDGDGEIGGDAARVRVLRLLKRHGWNATSFQILEPGFRYWFYGDDTCVGYVDTGRAWVAAGSPVAPPERFRRGQRAVRGSGHGGGPARVLLCDRSAVPTPPRVVVATGRRSADLGAR